MAKRTRAHPQNGPTGKELARGLGARLRKARKESGLSQGEVAAALGYAPSLVSALETGERRLKVDDLSKLCALFERSADYFLATEAEIGPEVGVRLRGTLDAIPHTSLNATVEEFLDYAALEFSATGPVPDLRDSPPEEAAKKVLRMAKLSEPPIDTDDVSQTLHIPVIPWSFPDSLSGLLADAEGGYVIGVNRSHHLNRRRFSIAHECAHAVLRHRAGFYMDFTDVDPFGERSPRHGQDERAANGFAAALLMPARWLQKDFRAGLRDTATLAARYRVSEDAMSFRLRNLQLM
jgi:Zn-dependent peptidase ImmA (M78 family)/DNA-binding XRE family transcriptional regulator